MKTAPQNPIDFNEIKVFVQVAQSGSFTQAAKRLGMPNSTVSAKVSGLERRLGVTLLQRTTRKLNLTQSGQTYFKHCLQGLGEIQKAEAELNASNAEAQGTLRVTAPIDMGSTCLTDLVCALWAKYPKIKLDFLFTDRFVDLVGEGVDVAIRTGELRDSGLIAKKLGLAHWMPFASPAYLKKAGRPTHPKELRIHPCIQFTPLGEASWTFFGAKSTITVPMTQQILGNDVNFVKTLCVAGKGIALLPSFACAGEVELGKLVRVLPEWRGESDPIHLLYPEQKFLAPKTRAFSDLATDVFKSLFSKNRF